MKEELRAAIAAPITTPGDARKAEEAARMLREILETEIRAQRLLVGEASVAYSTASSLAGSTIREAARRILERAGRPLHVTEIGVQMKAAGWRHPRAKKARPDQIEHSLAAILPKHSEFRKVRPRTFALSEWEHTKPPPPPLIGIFEGPGGATARKLSESREAAGASPWRSS